MQNSKLETGWRPLKMNVCTSKRSGLIPSCLALSLSCASRVLCLPCLPFGTSIIYFLPMHSSSLSHFIVILMLMKMYMNLVLSGELALDKTSAQPP